MTKETQSAEDLAAQQDAAAAVAAAVASPEAPVEPAVAPKTKGKAKAAVVEAPATKHYATPADHSHPFDIQIHGVVLQGQWSNKGKKVEFDVPVELVAGFELHHHFVVGNVVEAPATAE